LGLPLKRGTKKSKEEVAKEILSYFVRHPDAADTFLGIARWRLLHEDVHRSVGLTEEALTWLVEQGYLRRIPMPGIEGIFQINPEKVREARDFINAGQDERGRATK
jgi:hypothetical protein